MKTLFGLLPPIHIVDMPEIDWASLRPRKSESIDRDDDMPHRRKVTPLLSYLLSLYYNIFRQLAFVDIITVEVTQ